MTLPVVVIGAGGHASVLIDALRCAGVAMRGIVDKETWGERHGLPFLGGDDYLDGKSDEVALVNGVGSVADSRVRNAIFERFRAGGFTFPVVVHPAATVSRLATLAPGVQVMAGAVVQAGARIGENAIVNTAAVVDHDCVLGAHVHVSPGAILCAGITVGARSHIGAGAVVIQGLTIGHDTIVGAGAVVTRTLPDGVTAMGIPARVIEH